MGDLAGMLAVAAAGVLGVVVPGALLLRALRRRSITVHVCVLLTITVVAVIAGVTAASSAMFVSYHDLKVLLIVVALAGTVSLVVGWSLGRRLAAEAMWADESRARERQVEASRRDLIAWVSHDLRTPLAGLRAMAEALEDEVVSDAPTIEDYHRRIRTQADRMAGLVDDLFELSRIHAGTLSLSLSEVPLGDVVSDAVATAGPVAATRSIRLVAAESGWPVVCASEPELARIVGNLLRNAIDYTPDGADVSVTGGTDPDGGWLAIADSCGGIPDADLPHVFDVAFRGEAARTPRDTRTPRDMGASNGAGLGLAIVRGLVDALGGQVGVRNVGGGCRFVVRLPAAQPAA
jgi:signal transduction histidine kinase